MWYSVTHDPEERGDFFTGYLTWKNGKGGISWSGDRQSEDPAGPPPNADQDQRFDLQERLRAQGLNQQLEPLPVFEFTSDPLPVTLYVNSSRNVQFDLRVSRYTDKTYASYYDPCQYYKLANTNVQAPFIYIGGLRSGDHSGDPILNLELFAGSRLVAGTPESSYIQWYYFGGTRPADPEGYGTCRYRTPIEMGVIPAGTVLKLKITHLQQHQGFQYGMMGDHASVIRIPIFPPDEVLYRQPGQLPGAPEGSQRAPSTQSGGLDSEPATPGDPSILAPILAAPLLAPALRRNRRTLLLAALLAAGAFAGCMGGNANTIDGDAAPTVGRASQSIQPLPGGAGALAGLGTVLGQIHDDQHTPLSGAHVSLLGTNNFTSSDGRGRFLIPGVLPGVYELRVDLKGYQSLQSTVEVRANNVTRVDVLLVPVDQKDADRRRHKHDLWGSKLEHIAYSDSLGATCYDDPTVDCSIHTYFSLPPKMDGQTNIVFPGTGEVEIVLDWNVQQMGARRAGLIITTNGGYNSSILAARAPGEPFLFPVTWEMTDNGHQSFSTWYFTIYVPVQDVFDPTPLPESSGPPSFKAEVTLKRGGALPLEPAHPDRWGNQLWKVVQPNANLYNYWSYYPPGSPFYYSYPMWFYPKEVVPYGTTWIQVNITASREQKVPHEMTLHYKPGNTGYSGTNWKDAPVPKAEGLKRIWRIPIQEDESDSIYARTSTFAFQARIADDNARYLDGALGPTAAIQYFATIIAHKDPMPS